MNTSLGLWSVRVPTHRFDSPIHPMADLEMFFPMNFFWCFLFRGHSRTILAWLPLWQPWATFFIGKIPKWPPKWCAKFGNCYLFVKHGVWHMISGVLGAKKSISGDNMSIWFHLSDYSEQEAQMELYCSLENRTIHWTKWLRIVIEISNTSSSFPNFKIIALGISIYYEEILTRGPSVHKFHTGAQVFIIHVISMYSIICWKGWRRTMCILLSCELFTPRILFQ